MKARPTHRLERIGTLIQQTIAEALSTRVKDPRVGFATVTRVTVSADLSHAIVLVSVLGEEEVKQSTLAGLTSASGFLRSHLARNLELRAVPELHFHIDRGLEHAARINAILADLQRASEETD